MWTAADGTVSTSDFCINVMLTSAVTPGEIRGGFPVIMIVTGTDSTPDWVDADTSGARSGHFGLGHKGVRTVDHDDCCR